MLETRSEILVSGATVNRAILPFWRFWILPIMLATWVLLIAFVIPPLLPYSVAFAVIYLLMLLIPRRSVIRLCRYALTCRTLTRKQFSIHFPRRLSEQIENGGVIEACEHDVSALTRWFGFAPRQRIAVYVFEHKEDVGRLFGTWFGGYAIPRFNAALVPLSSSFRQLLRHELSHLFSARLGMMQPKLKSEGLAVWFECDGRSPLLAESTRESIRTGVLSTLLSPKPFLNVKTWRVSYEIAGSFTDFLIQRFGWLAYCKFYKAANQWNFQRIFERTFHLTLAQAESMWLQAVALDPAKANAI